MAAGSSLTDLGPTSDYTRVAHLYDSTRNVPPEVLRACYDRARKAGFLPAGGLVLDAGSGTGQMSLPLADMGYEVRGYDVTPAMVGIANRKAAGMPARYAVGDVRRLPEPDERFDAAVVGKLFQHVGHWELGVREIVRLLKLGACLIMIDERGAKNPVREDFSARLKAAGIRATLPGTRNANEITEALAAARCARQAFDDGGLTWTSAARLGDALDQLRDRLSAEFWSVPEDVYDRILAETAAWVDAQPGGRSAVVETPSRVSVAVFRKDGGATATPGQASPGR